MSTIWVTPPTSSPVTLPVPYQLPDPVLIRESFIFTSFLVVLGTVFVEYSHFTLLLRSSSRFTPSPRPQNHDVVQHELWEECRHDGSPCTRETLPLSIPHSDYLSNEFIKKVFWSSFSKRDLFSISSRDRSLCPHQVSDPPSSITLKWPE